MRRPEIRGEIDKYAANENLYLLQETIKPYTNSKRAFKDQKPKTLFIIYYCLMIIRETIKGIKALRVKCAPVTRIAKGAVMAHNNRCFLVRYGRNHFFYQI